MMVNLILAAVIGEVRTLMFDVELRLAHRVEARDQLGKPGWSHHQDDLVVRETIHFLFISKSFTSGLRRQELAQEVRRDVKLTDLVRLPRKLLEGECD